MPSLIGGPTGRLSDSTYIDEVDNGVKQLEESIAGIFALPLNTEISRPIFAYNDQVGSIGVAGDGSVLGELYFKGPSSQLSLAPGIKFEDETADKRYKIAVINGAMWILGWDDLEEEWNQSEEYGARELSAVATSFKGLEDTPAIWGVPAADKYLRMDGDGENVILVDAAGGGGATKLDELTDVQPYTSLANANFVLAVNPLLGSDTTYWRELPSAAPGGYIINLEDTNPPDGLAEPFKVEDVCRAMEIALDGATPKVHYPMPQRLFTNGQFAYQPWQTSPNNVVDGNVTSYLYLGDEQGVSVPDGTAVELFFRPTNNPREMGCVFIPFNGGQDYGRLGAGIDGLYMIWLRMQVTNLVNGKIEINIYPAAAETVAAIGSTTINPRLAPTVDNPFTFDTQFSVTFPAMFNKIGSSRGLNWVPQDWLEETNEVPPWGEAIRVQVQWKVGVGGYGPVKPKISSLSAFVGRIGSPMRTS
jgi:hypothetical protein